LYALVVGVVVNLLSSTNTNISTTLGYDTANTMQMKQLKSFYELFN